MTSPPTRKHPPPDYAGALRADTLASLRAEMDRTGKCPVRNRGGAHQILGVAAG